MIYFFDAYWTDFSDYFLTQMTLIFYDLLFT